jgi:hypothetical protein
VPNASIRPSASRASDGEGWCAGARLERVRVRRVEHEHLRARAIEAE